MSIVLGTDFYYEIKELLPPDAEKYRQLKESTKTLCFSLEFPDTLIQGMKAFDCIVAQVLPQPEYSDARACVHTAIEGKIQEIALSRIQTDENGALNISIQGEKNETASSLEQQSDVAMEEAPQQISDDEMKQFILALSTNAVVYASLLRFDASFEGMNPELQWREIAGKILAILHDAQGFLSDNISFEKHVYNLFQSPVYLGQFLDLAYVEIVKSFLVAISRVFPQGMGWVNFLNEVQCKKGSAFALNAALQLTERIESSFRVNNPDTFKCIVEACIKNLPLNPRGFTNPWLSSVGEAVLQNPR